MTTAKGTLRDLRVAEVTEMDIVLGDGGMTYRVTSSVSLKYHSD
jgi:flavin-binding protein dodecin